MDKQREIEDVIADYLLYVGEEEQPTPSADLIDLMAERGFSGEMAEACLDILLRIGRLRQGVSVPRPALGEERHRRLAKIYEIQEIVHEFVAQDCEEAFEGSRDVLVEELGQAGFTVSVAEEYIDILLQLARLRRDALAGLDEISPFDSAAPN